MPLAMTLSQIQMLQQCTKFQHYLQPENMIKFTVQYALDTAITSSLILLNHSSAKVSNLPETHLTS